MISKQFHHQLRVGERQPLLGMQCEINNKKNKKKKTWKVGSGNLKDNTFSPSFHQPGPPESMREHVVAASKAMKMGDWRTCHTFIINEKMNSKVWDLFPETQRVREMLVRSGRKKKKKKRPRSIHLYPSFFFDRSAKLHSLTCIRSTGKSRKSHWELIFSHTAVCMTPSGKRRGLPSTKRVQLGPYLSSHYVHRKF